MDGYRVIETLLTWLGYGLCHQLPERSLFGGGLQYPVCARDTGIYLGFLVAFGVIVALSRRRRPSELPPLWAWVAIAIFIGAMALDGVSSYAGWRATTNDLRLVTGLMAGFAIGALTVPLINGQLWKRPGMGAVLATPQEGIAWIAALPVTFAAVRWVAPHMGVFFPLLTGVAIVLTFCAVNLVIVVLLPLFERRAETLWDARLALGLALVLTFVELGLATAARVQLLQLAQAIGAT